LALHFAGNFDYAGRALTAAGQEEGRMKTTFKGVNYVFML
jgi:hypothetical protein